MTCPPLDRVRIGLIGLGNRGLATLRRYMVIDGVEIVALSDLRKPNLKEALSIIEEYGKPLPRTYCDNDRWMDVCEAKDINLIYICTDWASHADMAIYAMRHGKHVALEVPAAMTVHECWELVHTAEECQLHCIMLENCCYDVFHLGIMGMVKECVFGEITHCEGAYIHDLRDYEYSSENTHGSHKNWMQSYTMKHPGNPYPTHGLGPVCQIMGINKTDRLASLVSMSGLNGLNNTLIQTRSGKSILIQFDETTPRPYSRLQTLCGTKGYAQKYPTAIVQIDDQEPLYGEKAMEFVKSYCPQEYKNLIDEGNKLNVPNVMNYIMDRRLIDALLKGKEPDMNIYDAALWSCVTELSARSVCQDSSPVPIPDFINE